MNVSSRILAGFFSFFICVNNVNKCACVCERVCVCVLIYLKRETVQTVWIEHLRSRSLCHCEREWTTKKLVNNKLQYIFVIFVTVAVVILVVLQVLNIPEMVWIREREREMTTSLQFFSQINRLIMKQTIFFIYILVTIIQ